MMMSFTGRCVYGRPLGNSYNIPAVKALEFVGVCSFIDNVQKFGLASLQRSWLCRAGRTAQLWLGTFFGRRRH